MEWNKIYIHNNQLETKTQKVALIKMPGKSQYAGYKFWHPLKLVRTEKVTGGLSFSFNNEFVFRIFKNGQGRYNWKDVIDEKNLTPEEIKNVFSVDI